MTTLVVDSFDQVSVVVTFTGDFDNYEFAINGAFTAPSEINGTTYRFEGLFPGTEYRISAYNFDGQEPTTEAFFQIFTTASGVNVPTNIVLSNPQVSFNQILFTILNPDTFTTDNISVNDGFATGFVKSLLDNTFIISNLAPSTTYSIQYYDGESYIASYILKTSSVDPPGPEPGPETTTTSGLSDGAIIGIVFGSIFAFFLLYTFFFKITPS
jgi:hypothetical protein